MLSVWLEVSDIRGSMLYVWFGDPFSFSDMTLWLRTLSLAFLDLIVSLRIMFLLIFGIGFRGVFYCLIPLIFLRIKPNYYWLT
jgi:hypothetical protein